MMLLLIVGVNDKALEEVKSVLGSLVMEVGSVGSPFSKSDTLFMSSLNQASWVRSLTRF